MVELDVLPVAHGSRAHRVAVAMLCSEASRDKSQADKFRDLARELGCDDDEEAFKEKLREIAKSPPQHREKPKDERTS